jgi:hypothetical protein
MNTPPHDGEERTPILPPLTQWEKDLLETLDLFIQAQKERRNNESQSYGSEEQTRMD